MTSDDGSDVEDIPLDITGHEDRDRPGRDGSGIGDGTGRGSGNGDGTSVLGDPAGNGTDGTGNGKDPRDGTGNGTNVDVGGDDEDAVQPVEVLVGLARDGEIEPWDIDIVTVTDKFLDRLDESDLRTSGRALFYASVLLRMKGDEMLSEDDPEPEDATEPWEESMPPADAPAGDPFAELEREIDRRVERKRARGNPETLDELVRELREAERDNWWKESREYDTSDSPSGYGRGTQTLDYRASDARRMADEPTEEDVTATAHAEDIEGIVSSVYDAVREHYDAGRDEVLYAEIETAGGSRVETFLGLLFLSHRGQVRLRQDELFGDLWIQDPAAATGSGEAVAD